MVSYITHQQSGCLPLDWIWKRNKLTRKYDVEFVYIFFSQNNFIY